MRLAKLAALLALLSACSTPLPTIPSRATEHRDGFYFQPAGLADDYPPSSRTHEKITEDLAIAKALGAKYLRFGMAWDDIETRPDQYDWKFWDELIEKTNQAGILPLPYLCYTPEWLATKLKDFWRQPPREPARFARFAAAAARRYRGKVRSWELWNEPDNTDYWLGTEAELEEMLRLGAHAVRAADPSAKIVLGGLAHGRTPFSEKLVRALEKDFDVVNLHGYLGTWESEPIEFYRSWISAVASLLQHGDLWLAEFGYSDWPGATIAPGEHSPEAQARALWKAHVEVLATERVSLTTWYRIHDLPPKEDIIGDENNRYFGLIDTQGHPKLAYFTLQLYQTLLGTEVRALDGGVRVSDSSAVVHLFARKDGDWILTAWLPGRASLEQVKITLPDSRLNHWKIYDVEGPETQPAPGESLHDGVAQGVPLSRDRIFIARLSK